MNIRLLEIVAGNSSKAQQTIKRYKDNIYSRKVKDVMSEISELEMPLNGYTVIKEKWGKHFNDLIVRDIIDRWNKLEKIFNVEEKMLLRSVTSGCVKICWLLPNHLVKQATCSATKFYGNKDDGSDDQSSTHTQELFPEPIYLIIGDNIIKDDSTSKLRTSLRMIEIKI